MKEKLRSEIEEKYKWDLTKIYENDEEWEKDYKEVSNGLRTIEKYKGKILESANTLFEMVTTYFNVARKVEKVYIYAHLNYDAETGNTKYQNYDGMVKNLLVLCCLYDLSIQLNCQYSHNYPLFLGQLLVLSKLFYFVY